jgi:hypothetical protein
MIRSTVRRAVLLAAALGLAPAALAQSAQPAPGTPAPGVTRPPPTLAPPELPGGQGDARRGTGAGTEGPAHQGGGSAAPQAGANSFTAEQARTRITEAGFTDVTDLRLDDRGVWRGHAMRGGEQVGVALDYRGNVTQFR